MNAIEELFKGKGYAIFTCKTCEGIVWGEPENWECSDCGQIPDKNVISIKVYPEKDVRTTLRKLADEIENKPNPNLCNHKVYKICVEIAKEIRESANE